MGKTEEKLLREAEKVLELAYAPYSNYKVAAALLTEEGRIFTGVNVENASYGLTICAERAALFSAVAAGCRFFSHILITAGGNGAVPYPCGACRQVLMEFSPDLQVIVVGEKGKIMHAILRELLPNAFG